MQYASSFMRVGLSNWAAWSGPWWGLNLCSDPDPGGSRLGTVLAEHQAANHLDRLLFFKFKIKKIEAEIIWKKKKF